MKKLFVLFLLLSCQGTPSRDPAAISSVKYPEFELERNLIVQNEHCREETLDELKLSWTDYDFKTFESETGIEYYGTREDIKERYLKIYSSGKRLKERMYKDGDEFILPFNGHKLQLGEDFLKELTHQIEMAHQLGASEYLIFPDTGHGHILLPMDVWKNLKDLPKHERLQKSLSSSKMKLLYHTAEKLMMKNGPLYRDPLKYRKFRYRFRNLIGSFNGLGALEVRYAHKNQTFNTLDSQSGLEGHYGDRTSLYFSASKFGCLGYEVDGKQYFFDLSLKY